MFLTANAFAVSLLKETAKISVGWMEWAVGFLPVGLVLFVSLPPLVYVNYPPGVTASEDVPAWADQELTKMGPISRGEVMMAGVAVLALGWWIFGGERLSPPRDATGPALIYFGGGYITRREFWMLGSVFGAIYLLLPPAAGVPYLLVIRP